MFLAAAVAVALVVVVARVCTRGRLADWRAWARRRLADYTHLVPISRLLASSQRPCILLIGRLCFRRLAD